MDKGIKSKISLYGIISAIAFVYLILTSNPGISFPVFFIIQFAVLFIIAKSNSDTINMKGLLMLIPIFIISSNRLISASYLMMPTNFLMVVFLYSVMFLLLGNNLDLMKFRVVSILKIIVNIFEPIINFIVPFRWIAEREKSKEKSMLMKRIMLGVVISMPSVFFLIGMLSSADLVFQNSFISFNKWINNLFEFLNVFKLIIGTFAGLYLFGHLYSVFNKDSKSFANMVNFGVDASRKLKGDIIVFNILLVSILVIYTIFIAIQFKYLFSAGILPDNLNYAEYARRGFFELVLLSVINIVLIMLTTYLLRDKIYEEKNKWGLLTNLMLIYLCIITGILLISSYYRMSLYDSAYGFTRLRILVYMFLIFEAAGLIATLTYVIKHNFNILAVYAAIGLAFYLTLNVVKIDEVIAKRNIDMYFAGQTESLDMEYLMTLSEDAAAEIVRLLDKDIELITRNQARIYLEALKERYSNMEHNWQSYNLIIERNKELLEVNKDKLQFKY